MNAHPDKASFVGRPFGCPLDVILDIPVPLSVNRTRKINKAALGDVSNWLVKADAAIMVSGQYRAARQQRKAEKPCEIRIILDPKLCKLDPDNPVKNAIDYLRRIELIENDTGKHVRKITIEWGEAPKGCRIVLTDAV